MDKVFNNTNIENGFVEEWTEQELFIDFQLTQIKEPVSWVDIIDCIDAQFEELKTY